MSLWRKLQWKKKKIIKINIKESLNELSDESEEELIKELNKESGKELNKESDKETSDEELIEIINPKKDEDTADWYDKNKFKKILLLTEINSIIKIK